MDSLIGQVLYTTSDVEKNLLLRRENVRRHGKSGNIFIKSLDSGGRLVVFRSLLLLSELGQVT